LATGAEVVIDHGPGTLHDATVVGPWVQVDVHDPVRGRKEAMTLPTSGPFHRIGGRRCWPDAPNVGHGRLDRRWLPLAGGAPGKKRPEVLMALGPDLVLTGAGGALALEAGGTITPIAPAECKPTPLARSHEDRSLLFACATTDPAELRLWREGAARTLPVKVSNPPAEGEWLPDLERAMYDMLERPAKRIAQIELPDEKRAIVDLVDGRTHPIDEHSPIASHGRRVLLYDEDSAPVIFDGGTGTAHELPEKGPGRHTEVQRGRLFAVGPRSHGDQPPGMLIDIEAAAVLGRFAGPALTVSTTGWVLSAETPRPSGGARLGPLRWVRPAAP
jgi:hypothetical protein